MEQILDVFQKFVFNILVAVLPVLAVYVIAWVKAQVDLRLSQIENSKPKFAEALRSAASLAVQAAEQAGFAKLVDDKKQYAFNIAQIWLDENGWEEIDIDILDAAIEAEVNKLYPNVEVERAEFSAW